MKEAHVSNFSLTEEIRRQRKAIESLEAENKRILKNSELQARANRDLQEHLGELEAQLSQAMVHDGQSKALEAFNKSLVAESHKTLEDLIKLGNKLTKAKNRLCPSDSSHENFNASIAKTPKVIRRNLIVLAEELVSGIERLWNERKDIENELTIERDSADKIKEENIRLVSENAILFEEKRYALDELETERDEHTTCAQRLEETEGELYHLKEQKIEFVRQRDLEERLLNLEELLDKNIHEKALLEFKLGKLKKYVGDERLLFYIDSWATTQSEITALEKKLLNCEIDFSKQVMAQSNREQNQVDLKGCRSIKFSEFRIRNDRHQEQNRAVRDQENRARGSNARN